MQSLVATLLFDELFHSAPQLMKVLHNIKNSRLIHRCLSLILPRAHEDKDRKKLFAQTEACSSLIFKDWLQSQKNRKTYQSNQFYWYRATDSGVSSHCLSSSQQKSMNHFPFLDFFTFSLLLPWQFFLEKGLLSTIKSHCRLYQTGELWTLSPLLIQFILSFCCCTVSMSCNI